MRSPDLDSLRHQTWIVTHIVRRDMPKTLAAGFMMMSVCWHAGAIAWLPALATAIVGFEIIARLLTTRMPEREQDVPVPLIAAVWLVNTGSTVLYLLPSVILASQPSVPLMLVGFMWLFGVYVHISNTFFAVPFFNWSQMTPAFGMAFAVFWVAASTTYVSAAAIDWFIAAVLMVVYILNTFGTLNKQKDTQAALGQARAEANARLRDLEHINQHDALTGLLNRRAFDEWVAAVLAHRVQRGGTTVFLIDLDGFKPINDTYSHDAGDQVLIEVARRLRQIAGETGIAARLGGDEFALAFPVLSGRRDALQLADRAARAIEKPISYGEKELWVAASIGVRIADAGETSVEQLCGGADQAMFRAKLEPGTNVVLYSPASFPPRPSLEDRRALLSAMAAGDIRPYYQPKVRLSDGTLCGFEALARWVRPGHTPHQTPGQPAAFLPQLNELGLQGDFMMHMASAVLADVQGLIDEGLDPGQVSINIPEVALATLSGRQDLDRLIARHPAVRPNITFEITEDVFIARSADMIQNSIAHFRRAGLRVSLDDFGTGFASFQHLRQLEFDELKIDTSFVAGLGQDHAAEVLIGSFLTLGAGLGVHVIAEGVETDAQLQHLRRLGCVTGQGYLFGRAMPLAETRIRLLSEQAGYLAREA